MKRLQKRTLSPWAAAIWFLILAALATGVSLWAQPGGVWSDTLSFFLTEPKLILLNGGAALLLMGTVFCLVHNVFYAGAITELIWGLLSYVNTLKTSARGDPFVPGDVLLFTEGLEAVGDYRLDMRYSILAVVLGVGLVLVLFGLRYKCRKVRFWKRLVCLAAVLGVFAGAMHWVYGNNKLYDRLKGPHDGNIPRDFEQYGFPYCFLHNFNLYPVEKPEGYSKQEAQQWDTAAAAQSVEDKPNIIMIMCESFSDLPNNPAFTYGREDNPIAGFNALAEREDTVSGHIIVSNYGAGTANTEFDVLTGMMTNRLSPATTSAFRVVHRNTASIPRMLEGLGYDALFLHPGKRWFYNRQSVYGYLGITDQIFEQDMTDLSYEGSFVSDQCFLENLERALESRDKPLFTYGVTIQNHQSYTYAKYQTELPAPKTDRPLSEEATEHLSVYFRGLEDGSKMLVRLTQYLDEQTEPYILVFFGDHLPNLGANYLSYRELGINYGMTTTTQELLDTYRIPFVIWGNQAYRAGHDLAAKAAELGLGEDITISSHYLGALTCELAGITGQDAYFDYLNTLRRSLPVDSVYGYRLADGSYTAQLPEDMAVEVNKQWQWQYYRLKDK